VKDRIAKSVFWMAWSRVVLQAVSFLSSVLVARLLSPLDYGLMALAGIWISFIGLLTELGLGSAIVQFRDLDDRELNTCFWLTMGVATLGYGTLYAAAPLIAQWFGSPRLSTVLRVVGLTLPLIAVRLVPDGLLRRRLELDRVSRVEIAAALVTIPVVLGMAWAGAGVWALVVGTLTTGVIQSAVYFALVPWRPGLRMGGRRIGELLHYSLALLGSRVSWALYEQSDAFVLGKVSGDVVLGFYSMAKQLALLPVEKLSVMVNQIATPVMAELQADRESLRAVFLRGARLVAWTAFPLSIGLMLVARDFVEVVLTEKWLDAVPLIQVLCVYALVRSVAVLLPPVLMARYRARFLLAYGVAMLTVMPLAFWGGAVWWGSMGVAIAWVAIYPVILSMAARETFHAIGLSSRTVWTHLWPPTAAALTMGASVLAVGWLVGSWPQHLAAGRLTLMVLVGAATYAAALFIYGGLVRSEIQEITGWLLHRGHALTAEK
jgi:O-antigen/teichoic acid export membrane protein